MASHETILPHLDGLTAVIAALNDGEGRETSDIA